MLFCQTEYMASTEKKQRGVGSLQVGWADIEEEGVWKGEGGKQVRRYKRRQPLACGQKQRWRLNTAASNLEQPSASLRPTSAHFCHRKPHPELHFTTQPAVCCPARCKPERALSLISAAVVNLLVTIVDLHM